MGLGVDLLAPEEALHRAVVTAGVAGLIAGGKRVVDVSLEPECLPADGVDDRMTHLLDVGILGLEPLDPPERLRRRVALERLAKQTIEAFSRPPASKQFLIAAFDGSPVSTSTAAAVPPSFAVDEGAAESTR